MTLSQRIGNLIGVTVPLLGFAAAIVLLWEKLVGPHDLAILVAMYLVSALGTTVGFHRLLTHRSFQTYKGVEYVMAVLGSTSVQGSVVSWVAAIESITPVPTTTGTRTRRTASVRG